MRKKEVDTMINLGLIKQLAENELLEVGRSAGIRLDGIDEVYLRSIGFPPGFDLLDGGVAYRADEVLDYIEEVRYDVEVL